LAKLMAAEGELPLQRLLRRMRDERLPEDYRDRLAIAACAYTHPRLSMVGQVKLPSQMTDNELIELIARTEADIALRDGQPWPRLAVNNSGR
jgi:hypothetical protein